MASVSNASYILLYCVLSFQTVKVFMFWNWNFYKISDSSCSKINVFSVAQNRRHEKF